MKIGYIRTSIVEKDSRYQHEILAKYGIERFYEEHASCKDKDRPVLREMLNFVSAGDEVYIVSFSNVAKTISDLLNLMTCLQAKNVRLVSLKEDLDTTTEKSKSMIATIAAVASFQQDLYLEKQKEGIAIARAKGRYKGRTRLKRPENFIALYRLYEEKKISTKMELALRCHVSIPVLYRFIKEFSAESKNNSQEK